MTVQNRIRGADKKARDKVIVALYNDGMSQPEIADKMNLHFTSISRILTSNNVITRVYAGPPKGRAADQHYEILKAYKIYKAPGRTISAVARMVHKETDIGKKYKLETLRDLLYSFKKQFDYLD